MIYSEKYLGEVLKTVYDNAPRNEQVLMIHLFGIKYGHIIEGSHFKIVNIVAHAGISESYKTEISKGVKLSHFVQIIPEKDTF